MLCASLLESVCVSVVDNSVSHQMPWNTDMTPAGGRAYDILQVDVDKVVERVDVLLDETFDGQKGWQELPFVLYEDSQFLFFPG
jgi:hypothetical protein